LLFPNRDGFTVKKRKTKDKKSAEARTIYVGCISWTDRLCILTWSAPGKFAISPEADPFRYGCETAPIYPNTICRIHCEGIKLAFYALIGSPRNDNTVHYRPDSSLKRHGYSTENWDSELFEPLGYERLVLHARKARQVAGLPWEHWVPDTSHDAMVAASVEAGIELPTRYRSLSCETNVKGNIMTGGHNSSPVGR
jgi:hypothetical protein